MGFLPVFYAGAFVFIAGCAYVCFSVVAGLDALGKRLFVAIVAFGASSFVGYIILVLAISQSPFGAILNGPYSRATLILAYVIPGLLGSWASIKLLQALRPSKPRQTTTPSTPST